MIDSELETQIRHALSADAAQAPQPSPAVFRSRKISRTRQPRMPWSPTVRIAGVIAAALVTAGIAVIAWPAGSSPEAIAGWRSRPEPAGAATMAVLGKACRADTGVSGVPSPPVTAVDLRGDGAYVVLADKKTWVDCLATRRPATSWAKKPTWITVTDLRGTRTPTAADPLVLVSVKAPEGNGAHRGAEVTWVSGRVAPSVTRVRIDTATGQIEATVAGGVFAAWWPGNDADHAVISGFTKSGAQIVRLDQLTCTTPAGRADPRTTLGNNPPTGGCA